jgi:hypothetical protein
VTVRSGYKDIVVTVLVISVFFTVLGLVIFFALTLWAAREDGRDQERRDRRHPR